MACALRLPTVEARSRAGIGASAKSLDERLRVFADHILPLTVAPLPLPSPTMMFRTIANASLRRPLHTSSRPAAFARPARLRAVLGASAVATSYFVWNSWYGQRIALDAPSSRECVWVILHVYALTCRRICTAPKSKQVPLASESSTSPESIAHSDPTAPQHEPSIHGDLPSPSDASAEEKDQSAEGEVEGSSPPGGAFNPETGEINWDCPCLGGMAHGPCGMQFREAFSCFVFSEADPKGIDCVEKFKAMQECFREHPDVYGEGTFSSSLFISSLMAYSGAHIWT